MRGVRALRPQSRRDNPAPREFRTTPAAAHDVHANLSVGNVDFRKFAHQAARTPDGVLRPRWTPVPGQKLLPM
ncbi:DUF6924 domain-containing protein [Streptomyces smaragdinus]|uniref:DUF6924 domain-containing protein n=1 Tax=Streptomyces smaragdinus TaxID=2585196 RepID=UPI00389AC8D8